MILGLIIAATAELAGLIVLHLDKDFDVMAEAPGSLLSGRPCRDAYGTRVISVATVRDERQ